MYMHMYVSPCSGTVSWDDNENVEREEASERISVHSDELSKSDVEMETHTKEHEGMHQCEVS